ncbi:hypothetical protein [Microvirga makkahensis]|uniref:hypothetical protein n=1 Tax=Microvirga makkahensis TaxID=1128670 RepID=UPI001FE335E2|nr:hypothetical protein [Microvirga makkahensis]
MADSLTGILCARARKLLARAIAVEAEGAGGPRAPGPARAIRIGIGAVPVTAAVDPLPVQALTGDFREALPTSRLR